MNDDEINEIISRSEEESVIFHEIDMQREREALENWRRAGNRGKPPPPLMQLEELPECYRTDEPFGNENELDELEGPDHESGVVFQEKDPRREACNGCVLDYSSAMRTHDMKDGTYRKNLLDTFRLQEADSLEYTRMRLHLDTRRSARSVDI